MRAKLMMYNGNVAYETDDDWPWVPAQFSPGERVIYSVDGSRLILQMRHRNLRNDKWLKWQSILATETHEEMRKGQEKRYPFAFEELDAICLKTDDGDYVEHSR